jgi:hypothetical protein
MLLLQSLCAAVVQVVALAREVLGGNGVQVDFHVAKQFCDMEAIYTYEVGCLFIKHGAERRGLGAIQRESCGVSALSRLHQLIN